MGMFFGREKTWEESLMDAYEADGTLHSTKAAYEHIERIKQDSPMFFHGDD